MAEHEKTLTEHLGEAVDDLHKALEAGAAPDHLKSIADRLRSIHLRIKNEHHEGSASGSVS